MVQSLSDTYVRNIISKAQEERQQFKKSCLAAVDCPDEVAKMDYTCRAAGKVSCMWVVEGGGKCHGSAAMLICGRSAACVARPAFLHQVKIEGSEPYG